MDELVKQGKSSQLPATLNEAQLRIIQGFTPPEHIKKLKGRGGKTFDYVSHVYVTDTLNEAFGHNWDLEVKNVWWTPSVEDPKQVAVLVRLTVRTEAGVTIVKEDFGSAALDRYSNNGELIDVGDDLKSAVSEGLKKAASRLGVSLLDVYAGEDAHLYAHKVYEREQEQPIYRCADCGEDIEPFPLPSGLEMNPEQVATYTLRAYGKELCGSCGVKERERRDKAQVKVERPSEAASLAELEQHYKTFGLIWPARADLKPAPGVTMGHLKRHIRTILEKAGAPVPPEAAPLEEWVELGMSILDEAGQPAPA